MSDINTNDTKVHDTAQRWLRRFHPASRPAARLVCFPHAGGSASFYLPFSAALAPSVEVLAVQYPGRQDRRHEPPVGDLAELADRVVAALRGSTDVPLALFGHSMGAVLAFEVACRLQRRLGLTPVVLFASGRRAPSRVRHSIVHRLGDDGLVAELRRLSGTDDALLADAEMLRLLLPAVRGDYQAVETYRCAPGATLGCPVVVLAGDADPEATLDDVRAWEEHTTDRCTLRVFGGGHFFLCTSRQEVVDAVRQGLAAYL